MNANAIVRKIGTKNEAREQLKQQLAHYLEQQSESTRSLHGWMKRLELVSLGIIAAAFSVALAISIAWESFKPLTIPVAWFGFVASLSLTTALVGLHAMLLQAFPPSLLPGKKQKFITGRGAVWAGLRIMVLGLAGGAFWGLFAYAVGTFNLALIAPLANIIGILMAIAIVFQLIRTTFDKISKSL